MEVATEGSTQHKRGLSRSSAPAAAGIPEQRQAKRDARRTKEFKPVHSEGPSSSSAVVTRQWRTMNVEDVNYLLVEIRRQHVSSFGINS